MKITILTIFPEMFAPLHLSMLGRAEKAGLLEIREVDIRSYAKNKHRNTDDAPYGGGAGMVMLAQPIVDAMRDVQGEGFRGRRIYLSPRGETLTQAKVEELAKEEELILLCGHYEGVDQRALDLCIDEEISIGDYILTGGELGAMVLVDSVARLVPGVLGCEESAQTESFSSGLLEHPQYTRPREFEGLTVPEPLLNGNHAHIQDWQLSESLYITLRRRPELAQKFLDGRKFTRHQKKVVDAVLERIRREDEAAENARSEEGSLRDDVPQAGLSGSPTHPIRRLRPEEIPDALALIWNVFLQFEAPEYSEEGIATFHASLEDEERIRNMTFYGAFEGKKLVGVLCMRAPQHIAGFFVDAAYHRRGIGRGLFEAMRQDYDRQVFTVHSSPYAVGFYRRLGFVPTQGEQVTDGLRYTPMRFEE